MTRRCAVASGLRSERGATLVEFAFASALLFTTTFAAISGGLSVYRYNMLADLAQEGARWGSVRGLTSAPAFRAEGTQADLQTYLRSRNSAVPLTVTVDAAPNSKAPGTLLTVTVSSTWLPVSGFVPWGSFPISARAQMAMAR